MTIFQLKYGTAKLLFDSPIFKKFKGDGCYSYSLLLFIKKKKKKNSGSEERSDCEGEKGISIVLMELLFSILLKLLLFLEKNYIAKAKLV